MIPTVVDTILRALAKDIRGVIRDAFQMARGQNELHADRILERSRQIGLGRQRDRRGNHSVFRAGSTTTCTARA